MKILKTETPYLTKQEWRKVLLATSIMTLCLYAVAMVFSLCGSKYFILNYQNDQMDKIEAWLRARNLVAFLQDGFITIEITIVLSFVLQKKPRWYYILSIYAIPLATAYLIGSMPSILELGFAAFSVLVFL